MYQQKTVTQCIFKSLLFVPMLFAFLVSTNAQTTAQRPVEEKIYSVVEERPLYVGGDQALMDFISRNLKYPVDAQENGVQGTVLVRFVVSKLGKTENVEILRSLSPSTDKEAVRVINLLSDWIPGKQNGEKVGVYYTLPIKFKLVGDSKPQSLDSTKRPLIILDGKIAPINYNFSTLNKDSIEPIDAVTPDKKERLAELALKYQTNTFCSDPS